jgi:hypothetical protein
MTAPRGFAVDPRRVVHETIDGETILIALETGVYYSLSGSGPEIWDLVAAGLPEDEVIAEMKRRHAADPGLAGDATRELLAELVSENLVVEVAGNGTGNGHLAPPAPTQAPGDTFSTPVLKKYTDMEFFLQLDPIHEVDAAGWPHERQDATPDAA